MKPYVHPDTEWLAGSLGVAAHWTSWSRPLNGDPLPFEESVNAFDVDRFVSQIRRAGARHFIFTTTHAEQKLPAPHPLIDDLIPGYTTRRDLLGELCEACEAAGIRMIFYYNHSCNGNDNTPWRKACGYDDGAMDLFAARIVEIVEHMSRRYGKKLHGWWFDSFYSLSKEGPCNSVTTDLGDWKVPYAAFTGACQAGNPDSIVTYNSSVNCAFSYTPYQDYYWGEVDNLDAKPRGPFTEDGFRWHLWTCIDNREWVHFRKDTPFCKPVYGDAELADWTRGHLKSGGAVTFNVECTQDAVFNPESIAQLERIAPRLA